jgi:hypothetical protein
MCSLYFLAGVGGGVVLFGRIADLNRRKKLVSCIIKSIEPKEG